MALSFLVDTSVLTRLADPSIRDAVRGPLASGQAGRCSITDLELGFSARNADEWDRIQAATAAFGVVEVTAGDFARARPMQRALAAAGLKGRKVPDLLIAAAAERTGRTVLHYDRDFELIATITGQAQAWVVPPGTID